MNSTIRAAVGGIVWLAGILVLLPSLFDVRWAQALLVLATLSLVPLGLGIIRRDGDALDPLWRWVDWLQLPAALSFAASHFLPQGLPAACLAFPWLCVTALVGLAGVHRIWRKRIAHIGHLCSSAALLFLPVGGAWAVADRLGFRPLDFEPTIVLLTAIHFHYAGFVLPLLAGLCIEHSRLSKVAGMGVITGVPLVAAGITATQLQYAPMLECLAALWLAGSGALLGALRLALALRGKSAASQRCAWAIAGACLLGAMLLAMLYGLRFFIDMAWLDIPWMRALHGTANAVGTGSGLLAWRLAVQTRLEQAR